MSPKWKGLFNCNGNGSANKASIRHTGFYAVTSAATVSGFDPDNDGGHVPVRHNFDADCAEDVLLGGAP